MGSDTAHVDAACTPNDATSPPTTTWAASNAIQTGGTTAKEVHWEGSRFDTSADKTAPVGGASSQDHGRPTTRGQGDGGRSISHPRGMQEKASVQPPHQEGDLPSGSMPGVPPPAAPERTQPQRRGQPKTSHSNPT